LDLLILSRKAELYSTRRLVEEGQKAGHSVQVWDPGQPADLCFFPATVIIPRLGSYEFAQALTVLEAFEERGMKSLNSSESYRHARNKWTVAQTLQKYNLPLPRTELLPKLGSEVATSTAPPLSIKLQDPAGIKNFSAINDFSPLTNSSISLPCIMKRLESSQGEGVYLVHSPEQWMEIRQRYTDEALLMQEWIEESQGEDIRAFVVNNEVVAAMKRKALPGEFRSNLHLGGIGEKCTLKSEEASMAVELCQKLQLTVAGIDLLRSHRGSLILEANPCPGLEGIEKYSQINVAKKIIETLGV